MLALFAKAAASLAVWEAAWWARRSARRTSVYAQALHQARFMGRPLVVIGAPDGGVTSGYGCGDITVDLNGSATCPVVYAIDLTTTALPLEDNSVVVFVSCVFEYVSDVRPVLDEIQRVSGGYIYVVGVEPWTLTAVLYPGARRTMPSHLR